MNNNVVNAFNHEDHNTWRWNDRLLANTPLEENEPQRIRQVAGDLHLQEPRIIELLDTSPNRKVLEILTLGLNDDQQKQIACRAAIIIKAQAKREIHLRGAPNNAVNAHTQMTHFLTDLPQGLVRINRIHKAMDSHFAAQAFRRGRTTLNDYNYTFDHSNCHPRYEIKKDSLIQFFNLIVGEAGNDQNYIQINRRHTAQDLAIFMHEAYEYLKEIYDNCKVQGDNPLTQRTRASLNQLIASEQGANIIRAAIQSNAPSSILSTSLKSLARTNQITPEEIAQCIQFAYAMAGAQEGLLDRNTINEILSHPNGARAILAASRARIVSENLSRAIARASNDINYPLDTLAKKIQYIFLASSLIENHDGDQPRYVNELLNNETGVSVLALARYLLDDQNLDNILAGRRLGQSLYHVINNNGGEIQASEETRARYLKLILDTFYLMTPYHLNTLLRIKNKSTIMQCMNRYLENNNLKLSFNQARAANLEHTSIAKLMSIIEITTAVGNNIAELSENINFTSGIIQAGGGIQVQEGINIPVNADLVNAFINDEPSASQILHRARATHFNALSIAHLMSVANSHSGRLSNIKSAIKLINDPAAPRLGVNIFNARLADINNAIILNNTWRQGGHPDAEIKNAIEHDDLAGLLILPDLTRELYTMCNRQSVSNLMRQNRQILINANNAGLNARSIARVINRTPQGNIAENLHFITSIINLGEPGEPNVNADRINAIINQDRDRWFSNRNLVNSINDARRLNLVDRSVVRLIGGNHPNDNIIENIKCLTDIIGNDLQIAADLINPYLRLNNAIQNLNGYRGYTNNLAGLRLLIDQALQIHGLRQDVQALQAAQNPIAPAPVPPVSPAPAN